MDKSNVNPRAELGRQLYRFAWAFEICAVLIGLAIALMQGYSSFDEMKEYNTNSDFVTGTNIFIAAMPFVMVALVEITKIPFVGAFYQSKRLLWKLIFGFTLCFMAAITFESAANGFERNFNALIFGINDFKRNLSATEEKIKNLTEQRIRLSNTTSDEIETEFREKYAELSSARANDAEIVSSRKSELRATTETETLLNLRDEIKDQDTRRKELQTEKTVAISEANDRYQNLLDDGRSNTSSQLRNLQLELQNKQNSYDDSLKRSYTEIEKANIFTRGGVEEEWDVKLRAKEIEIQELENDIRNFDRTSYQLKERENLKLQLTAISEQFDPQINDVTDERTELRRELSRAIGTKDKDIEVRVEQFNIELASIEARFDEQQDDLKRQKGDVLERFKSNSNRIDTINGDIDNLNSQRLDLRKEINTRVGNNQVYRMAQMIYGKEQAADIDRQEVTIVASVWFGSLAALIAFTGIMLALASYVLKDESEKTKATKKYRINRLTGRLVQSARRYFVSKRRTQKLPIIKEVPREIIKEIEVSRVVTVEKPVEVVVREVVHVPFYTNDKNLLNISDASGMSENITNVDISTTDAKIGESAPTSSNGSDKKEEN